MRGKMLVVFAFLALAAGGFPAAVGLPVIPGAVGFGTDTPAGRGGTVLRVTNLNPSGPGSLRAALIASGPRVVIFDVSGTIELTGDINITNPYLTIAGQTAPSPGIIVKGGQITIITHDVLIQHLAVRPGNDHDPEDPVPHNNAFVVQGEPALGLNAGMVVLDHVSGSWTTDQVMSTWADGGFTVTDVTVRNSIFAEGLVNSGLVGNPGRGPLLGRGTSRITYHRNVLAYNIERNPLIRDNITDVVLVDNFVFWPGNAVYQRIYFGSRGSGDWPMRASAVGNMAILRNDASGSRIVHLHVDIPTSFALYQENNRVFHPTSGWLPTNGDPWSSTVTDLNGHALASVKASSPPVWNAGLVSDTTDLENRLLTFSGARPADRDPVDTRIVANIRNRTGGFIDNPGQVGGYPNMAENTRVLTLPPDHNGDSDQDGYTNLEEWLHAMAAEVEGEAPPDPTGVILDDFEDGNANGWSPEGTTAWSVVTVGSTKVYRQTNTTADARSILGGTDWTDQVVEAEARPVSFAGNPGWFGLAARYTDSGNYYYLLVAQSGLIELKRIVNGTFIALDSGTFAVTPGTTYRLRLEAIGPSLKAYIDDQLVLEAVDASHARGSAGLLMWRTSIDYDNVLVTPSAPTQLLADDFEDGDAAGWTPGGTTAWSVVVDGTNRVYRQTNVTSDARSIAGATASSAQIVEAEAKPTAFAGNPGWFGLAARYTDSANYYYVLVAQSGLIELKRIVNGTFIALDSGTFTVTPNTTYRLRLQAIGTSLKAYIDGQLVLEASDASHASGSAGVLMWKTAVDYDDVVVRRP